MDNTISNDRNEKNKTDETNSSGPVLNCAMLSQRKATYYNMNHKNRGIALIFNQEIFESYLSMEKRSGTNRDVACMKQLLLELGFQVFVYRNNKFEALERRIREAAEYDHTNYDCFVMVVLTHGDENDILYAKDSCYSFAKLWLPFTADSCPTLAGKPKLFFIQACRGAALESVEVDTPSPSNASYKVPSHADFLFFYSSSPGYASIRNTKTGAWFIQVLCRIFENNVYNYDVSTLLILVIQGVAIDCKTNLLKKNSLREQYKQLPCFTSNLTRLLKFEKKINKIAYPGFIKNAKVTKSKPKPEDVVDTLNENEKVKKSEEISYNAVVNGIEELVVTTSSTCNEENPAHWVEDHGGYQTRNSNLEEDAVNYPVQVETWRSTEFVKSVLFFALTLKKSRLHGNNMDK